MTAAIRFLVSATILTLVLALENTPAQTTVRVPGDKATIQAAIDAARAKDVILVAPGVYRENIDFKGKAIEVRSSHGPELTTIDGGFKGSTVTFRSGEDSTTLLIGFTVMGGSGTGVGLFRLGGGIYCYKSSPLLGNNIIRGNLVTGLFGQGGGVYFEGGHASLVACVLDGNHASHAGGGLYASDASLIVARCRFNENNADLGGGAFLSRGSITLWNASFVRNTARGGGGLYSHLNQTTTKRAIHTTFVGNKATSFGGGIASASESLQVANSILWDNQAPIGPEMWLGRDCSMCLPTRVDIRHTDLKGSAKGAYVEAGSTLVWGQGMIALDPKLVDVTSGSDVHLRHDSPCRNAGDKTVSGLPVDDMDGDPRVVDSLPDMGADEWAPRLYGRDVAHRSGLLEQVLIGASGGGAVWAFSLRGLDPGLTIPGVGTLVLDPTVMSIIPLGTFPQSGVIPVSIELPRVFPVAYLFTQALAGNTLTNGAGLHILDPPSP